MREGTNVGCKATQCLTSVDSLSDYKPSIIQDKLERANYDTIRINSPAI